MTRGQQGQQRQQNPTIFLAGSAPRESCGKVLSSRPQPSPRREVTSEGLLAFEALKGSRKNAPVRQRSPAHPVTPSRGRGVARVPSRGSNPLVNRCDSHTYGAAGGDTGVIRS